MAAMTKKDFNAVLNAAGDALNDYDYPAYWAAVSSLTPGFLKKVDKIIFGMGLGGPLTQARNNQPSTTE